MVLLGLAGLAAVGCKARRMADQAEATPLPQSSTAAIPADTIQLSAMMRELSAQPGFTETFLQAVEGAGKRKAGAALLTPELLHRLREMIVGGDWQGLDRFPGWTMAEINPTVRVVGHFAGKDAKIDDMATAGGAPAGAAGSAAAHQAMLAYLDLGRYTLGDGQTEDLDQPANGPGFDPKDYISDVGAGVTRGDGPKPDLAPLHAESQRLADVLNRLSLNGIEGAAPFRARVGGRTAASPQQLIAALQATGKDVLVADSRYFANFGHLHYKGPSGENQDVEMPFWVNSQIVVPGTHRPLLVPVAHAEYEWFITEPGTHKVLAAVSFYFGIDGKAEFRTMDQLDQAWVMNRHAHDYRGDQAVEVTRLSGLMVQAYAHQHVKRPKLPFGGYYALGVCQDVVAAIELKMTGRTTLFPNTADARLFDDKRDPEINGLIHRIPKDRDGRPPEVARIFGSLPVGDSDAELARVTVPGLAADLIAVHDNWTMGTLVRVRPRREVWARRLLLGLGLVLAGSVVWWVGRRRDRR